MTNIKAVRGVPLWSFVVHAVVVFVSVGEFVRVELVLKDYGTRMENIETSYKPHEQKGENTRNIGDEYARSARTRRNASSSSELEQIQKLVQSFCSSKNTKCATGPPGPPGKRGRKGPRGRKGTKGDIGITGRFGKRGIMGPRGLKGDKGDPGPQGMPGLKGDPGQSISYPDVVISPSSLILNQTKTAVFHCSSSGYPKPKFTWTKMRGSSASPRPLSTKHKLVISNVTSNHSGMYQCRASNILGSEQETIRLTVNYAPQVSLAKKPIFVQAGKNIKFPRCHMRGSPPPKVTWSRASSPLPHGRTSIQNGDLSVAKLKLSDSDTYFCKANNLLGSSVARLQLFVVNPVFVDKPSKAVKTETGLSFSMKCTATGSPKPTITWIKKGGSLPPPARSNIREGLLTVNGARIEDTGVYICIASIAGVRIQSSTKVSVTRGENPLGMESKAISDDKITASTVLSVYYPYKARLNLAKDGWAPTSNALGEWIQVDLSSVTTVTSIATQGRYDHANWVKTYSLQHSMDGTTFTDYEGGKIFVGNTDQQTVVNNAITPPIRARYIRVYPKTWNGYMQLRMELYGYK